MRKFAQGLSYCHSVPSFDISMLNIKAGREGGGVEAERR